MRIIGEKVILRTIEEKDLKLLWNFIYGDSYPEWRKWDAPYYTLEPISYRTWKHQQTRKIQEKNCTRLIIEADGIVIGMVTYYFEHEASRWLECGIAIYRSGYWNGGYGTEALKLWVNYIFENLDLARVGITTWSGNQRMMRVAEKIGMQLEGRIRKCHYYNGEYYDSIRMGILREEWLTQHPNLYKGRIKSLLGRNRIY